MRRPSAAAWLTALGLIVLLPIGCGDEDNGVKPDTTPPGQVTDLSVPAITDSTATLTWTAPGDDGSTGTASEYDIRYSDTPITTETIWNNATPVDSTPTPKTAGMPETLAVTGLNGKATTYFALKAADEVPNWSVLSNVASGSTDETPPAAVGDLSIASTTQSSITLNWTAPGDDGDAGTAAGYDIRYSESDITSETDWGNATQATGEPAPQVADSPEEFTITGLDASTPYYVALKAVDEAGNWSALSNVPSDDTAPDTTPPEAVTDLTIVSTTQISVTLSWTAPGDDEDQGAAAEYDIRYSESEIASETDWESAAQATGEPVPQVAGSAEEFTLTGLSPNETYHVALKTADEVSNWSGLSNVPSGMTWPEDTVLIPAGTFTMGSDSDEGSSDERPEHQPNISAFYMGMYEVTNAQYADGLNWAIANTAAYWNGSDVVESSGDNTPYLLVSDAGCRIDYSGSSFVVEAGYEDHPVVDVTWYGAAAYCDWRNVREGLATCYDTGTWSCSFAPDSYRLPTEAEWEKGARGSSGERTYPWGEDAPTCGIVNWSGCAGGTSTVGSYGSGQSPYGLHDMAGNTWEWCNDWYSSAYYSISPASDPTGPASGTDRTLRGGSWGSYSEDNLRCAVRHSPGPADANHSIGFRCVRSQ